MQNLQTHAEEAHSEPSKPAELAAVRGARVLVVATSGAEDLRLLLLSFDVVVDVVDSPGAAVESLGEHPYDLVIVGTNGRDALHRPDDTSAKVSALRDMEAVARSRHVPVVAEPRKSLRPGVADDAWSSGGRDAEDVDAAELATLLLTWIAPRDAPPARSLRRSAAIVSLSLQGAELPGFDIPAALERLGGNASLLASLLSRFADEHSQSADEVVDAMRSGRRDHAMALLHRAERRGARRRRDAHRRSHCARGGRHPLGQCEWHAGGSRRRA